MSSCAGFPEAKKFWHMGRFHDWSESRLHPSVHGLHYGTSVFEGIRVYATPRGPAVFRLAEHVDRLMVSAAAAHMRPPFSRDEIVAAVKRTVCENGLGSGYIRPLLFYAHGNLGLVPKACPVELAIIAWELGPTLGERADRGLRVYIGPWRRIHHTQFNMAAKLGGVYIQSAICGLEARQAGCDEAVFLNLEGRVAEGAGQNIFIVKDGVLRTNHRTESVLEGITRASLLEIAGDLGYRTAVGPMAKDTLFGADEAFFCGTAAEVVPIVSVVDASTAGGEARVHGIGSGDIGPITAAMIKTYTEAVTGRVPAYENWLTYLDR